MYQNLIWFLRILIVIQSLGYAAKLAAPSALNSYLLGSMGDLSCRVSIIPCGFFSYSHP